MPLGRQEIEQLAADERARRDAHDPAFKPAVLQACESYLALKEAEERRRAPPPTEGYWWNRD